MDMAEALQKIKDKTQYLSAPALSVEEVNRLLPLALDQDASGRVPGDDGYVDTYTETGTNRASAEGWRWKQGKVASAFDVGAGAGVSAKLSQQFEFCGKMASRYDRMNGPGSINIGASGSNWYRPSDDPWWWL